MPRRSVLQLLSSPLLWALLDAVFSQWCCHRALQAWCVWQNLMKICLPTKSLTGLRTNNMTFVTPTVSGIELDMHKQTTSVQVLDNGVLKSNSHFPSNGSFYPSCALSGRDLLPSSLSSSLFQTHTVMLPYSV